MSGGTEEDDLQAAEYVLGTLSAGERDAVERQASTDANFQAAISAWEMRLGPLATLVPPAAPPENLWRRIEYSLGMTAGAAPARQARRRLLESLGFWRGVSGAGFALAAALAVLVIIRQPGPVAPSTAIPSASGVLASTTGAAPTFLAEADVDGHLTLRPLGRVSVATGHDLELWALPVGGTKPVPLGVMPPTGGIAMLPKASLAGMQLMVSLEPPGGSTTGAPTGPVLFAGRLAEL
jgi:anti-sigma-K factor RskA